MTIGLRPALSSDEEFLFSVYAGTRAIEMDLVDWTPAQKEAFLRMQFRSQDKFYKEYYVGAEYQVILLDGQPIGRLYVYRMEDEIHVLDISLLPPYRGQGIGTHLMNEILEEGTEGNLPVTIYVERFNPAMHLYERLGFRLAEERGVHDFMRWLPPILEKDEEPRTTARQ